MIEAIQIPHIVKYMGSKRNLIDFIVQNIQEIDPSGKMRLYDVFAGSAVVGGAFRNIRPVTSNDIQYYSSIIGKIYLQNYYWDKQKPNIIDEFIEKAKSQYEKILSRLKVPLIDYSNAPEVEEIIRIENIHKNLLESEFKGFDHVFIQRFSGTYWSLHQCAAIDSIISTLRSNYGEEDFFYNVVHGALMFSMAYCSQSTGHYAQYRDLNIENIEDILIYRKKSIFTLFEQKIYSLKENFNGSNNSDLSHQYTNYDFLDSINNSEKNSIVYADPPYQFVHYSRFYHALETLVKYDYPEVRYKGRYRTDRHQSPFCIKTKVKDAFKVMFSAVAKKNSILVLSYSDNGMISLPELLDCANQIDNRYKVSVKEKEYLHSTMGRQKDKYREVKEILLLFEPI